MNQFTISPLQAARIKSAIKNKIGCKLRFQFGQLFGSHRLPLTTTQQHNVNRARSERRGLELSLSHSQLSKSGGALPLLLPLITGGIGAAASLHNLYKNHKLIKNSNRALDEARRQTAMLGQRLSGAGIKKITKKRRKGRGMYLSPYTPYPK